MHDIPIGLKVRPEVLMWGHIICLYGPASTPPQASPPTSPLTHKNLPRSHLAQGRPYRDYQSLASGPRPLVLISQNPPGGGGVRGKEARGQVVLGSGGGCGTNTDDLRVEGLHDVGHEVDVLCKTCLYT